MTKYTFLLPAYKTSFLGETLQSISEQSLQDFKVLISDDCSPEDIYSICTPYLDDVRFEYRRNEDNIGGIHLVKHWNLLVNMCDTEYLIMASDDDIYDKDFLNDIDILTQKYPDCNLFRARVRRIDSACNTIRRDACYEECVSQLEYIAQRYYTNSVQCISNFVFKTKVLIDKGGFIDFPLAWYSDVATTIMMAEHGLVNTRDLLFSFRISNDNISTEKKQSSIVHQKKLEAALEYDNWFVELFKSIEIPETIEYRQMASYVLEEHKKDIYYNISCYRDALSFFGLLHLLKKFKAMGYVKNRYMYYKLLQKKLIDSITK